MSETSMEDPSGPVPEERGALVPPTRVPPTAVGLLTPQPPEHRRPRNREPALAFLRRAVNASLDVADRIAEGVRKVLDQAA